MVKEGAKDKTTVDKVVAALQQAMFDGILLPGTKLGEEMLSQRFGVSRNTIREAIRMLMVDGLVSKMPQKSVVVHHLTEAEIEDIFNARLLLESSCVRAAGYCSNQILEELAQDFNTYLSKVRTRDDSFAAEAHIEIHASFVRRLSKSNWLAETERSLMRHLLLIIASVHRSSEDLQLEIEQHRVLCDLLSSRKIEKALVCLEADLMHTKAIAIKFSFEAFNVVKNMDRLIRPSYWDQ